MSTTYFAEGYPYAIVNNLADVMFKQLGASLEVVGLTSLFHLPWNLKFLWGPFVDQYATKRGWLLATQVAIIASILILAGLASVSAASLWPLAIAFSVLALLSATHDIAIDGFYLEALDERGQSTFVGFRAAAYKVAMVLVGGPLLWLCARLGWALGLALAAVLMGVLLLVHTWLLPRVETPKRATKELLARAGRRALPFALAAVLLALIESRWALLERWQSTWAVLSERVPALAKIGLGGWIGLGLLVSLLLLMTRLDRLRERAARREGQLSSYAESFVSFLAQPKLGRMLAFVLLFRTGESFLLKMRWPFLADVVGLELEFYAQVNGIYGVAASILATIIGGRLIARDGLRRWIWPFVLAQNVLNLLYMGLASSVDPTALSSTLVTVVITLEHVGSGLGTAVFMVYLMRTCDPAHKAGHFAIVSALMSVSFTLAGVFSGFLATALGFGAYFGFTFLATIPSMVLIPFVPHLDGREAS